MNQNKLEKLARFINDPLLSEAVYELLQDSFLKERPNQDVYQLAARALAVDYLKQGWRELQKFKKNDDEPSTGLSTPHL